MATPERCYPKAEAIVLLKQLNLHETSLGGPRGAIRQYRDPRKTNSYHVREYEDKICFHIDKYNPEIYPIEHLLYDDMDEKSLAGACMGFLIGCIVSRGDRRFGLTFALLGGVIGNRASS